MVTNFSLARPIVTIHQGKALIDKIEGPGSIRRPQNVQEVRRPTRTKGAGFGKHIDPAQESDNVAATGGIGALGIVGPVLELQEIDDALARTRRGKVRAHDILEKLEDIRLALLTGGLSETRLMQLVRMVSVRRPDIEDSRLAEILDEIDLRAKVELAKLGL